MKKHNGVWLVIGMLSVLSLGSLHAFEGEACDLASGDCLLGIGIGLLPLVEMAEKMGF
jgi:hypothetical protein